MEGGRFVRTCIYKALGSCSVVFAIFGLAVSFIGIAICFLTLKGSEEYYKGSTEGFRFLRLHLGFRFRTRECLVSRSLVQTSFIDL